MGATEQHYPEPLSSCGRAGVAPVNRSSLEGSDEGDVVVRLPLSASANISRAYCTLADVCNRWNERQEVQKPVT